MIWATLLWTALRTALVQIAIAFLSSAVMKELILVALKKLAAKTDNDVDDKIISIVDDAVHGRLPKDESEDLCPKCRSILDQ